MDLNKAIQSKQLERKERINSSFTNHDEVLEKGKKMPIGTISNGYKKVAEDKWVSVSVSHSNTHDKSSPPSDDSVHALESKIGLFEKQNITGYKEWHKLETNPQFKTKHFDVQRVQAFKKYKENLKKYVNSK